MQKIHAERLLKLASFLNTLKKEKFNFDIIAKKEPICGTVGCAIGWCPKVFPRSFQWINGGNAARVTYLEVCLKNHGRYNFGAVEVFFNISSDDSEFLFDPVAYNETNVSPKIVAKRIRSFVKQKLKESR